MINEKESLELITRMINSTKQNFKVGSGNVFLIYGYLAVALSIINYIMIYYTHNGLWSLSWFLMFLPIPFIAMSNKKKKVEFTTYTDKIIGSTWSVIGMMFLLAVLTLLLVIILVNIDVLSSRNISFQLMMPLSLILTGIGSVITGITLKEKLLTYLPFVGFVIGIYMMNGLYSGMNLNDLLLVMIGYIFTLVLPGHILNKKPKVNA